MKHNQFITAALVIATSIMALCGCARRNETDVDAGAPKVEANKITFPEHSPQLESLTLATAELPKPRSIRMTGRLVWNDEATVRIFSPVSGRIGPILANPGQQVAAGDALAKIASPEFGQAQAEMRKALADLELSDRAFKRVKELYEHGAAAQKDLEAAEAEHARAVFEHQRALATLAVYGGECAPGETFCALKAPIGGFIVDKSINPGQEVRADQVGADSRPLFVISDPSRLWVVLDATEADLCALRPGAALALRNQSSPSDSFPARIDVISDYLDPNSRTIKVRGTVDNAQRRLKAEMFVSAELPAQLQAGVTVPASALFLRGDRHYTFIERTKGTFQLQEVDVGEGYGGLVLVTKGLEAGQRVVAEGALLLNQILAENPAQPGSASLASAHD